MTEHYFGALTEQQYQSFGNIWAHLEEAGKEFTPAQIEQLCAEGDHVEDMVAALALVLEQSRGT